MTRRGFHILLAFILLICAACPYVEFAIHWNQTIFETGYDGESTVAIIALIVILAFALAKLLESCVSASTTEEPLFQPQEVLRSTIGFTATLPDSSPPLALRI